MEQIVVAIDPGREKCGVAVVRKQEGILFKQVIKTAELISVVQELVYQYSIATLLVGDRTTCRETSQRLSKITHDGQPLTIIPIDEHHSTDMARQRYWQENPPQGLKRFIPVTMQVPPVPVDDYVAVILAERYFKSGD